MRSPEVLILAGLLVMAAIAVGWHLYTSFSAEAQAFSNVYPVSAYVDADGDFLLCVYNAGPHDFYGRWLLSLKSGRSVEIDLAVRVGELAGARGSLGEPFTPGTSPALIVTTGGGSSYPLYPVVVPDVSSVNCGGQTSP